MILQESTCAIGIEQITKTLGELADKRVKVDLGVGAALDAQPSGGTLQSRFARRKVIRDHRQHSWLSGWHDFN